MSQTLPRDFADKLMALFEGDNQTTSLLFHTTVGLFDPNFNRLDSDDQRHGMVKIGRRHRESTADAPTAVLFAMDYPGNEITNVESKQTYRFYNNKLEAYCDDGYGRYTWYPVTEKPSSLTGKFRFARPYWEDITDKVIDLLREFTTIPTEKGM